MTAPTMTVKPLFVRWIRLSIRDKDGVMHGFECAVTQAGLTSTGGETQSVTTLCPEGSFSEAAERVWNLVVTGVQDVESAESFQLFLLAHDGEEAEFTYYPKVDKTGAPVGYGFKGTVTIAPPDAIGNAASGAFATFTATLPLKGKYTMIDENGSTVGGPATGAAPGNPGSWTPAGSQAPADIASAPPLTGTPAWAADAYVTAGSSPITWDGTAWVAYTGPMRSAASNGDSFPSDTSITASDATNAAKLTPAGYIADPTTAWATTEKITVNTFDFHWSGSAWAPGAAA